MDLDLALIETIAKQVSAEPLTSPPRVKIASLSATPTIEFVRDLTEADAARAREIVAAGDSVWRGGSPQRLNKIRNAHHQVARLVAEGTRDLQIAAMTGYATGSIARLRNDPMFQELVEYYRRGVESAYLSVHERRAEIGIMAMEHLRDRLEDDAEAAKISTKTMMELAEFGQMDKLKGQQAAQGPANGGGIQVNISFPQSAGAAGPVVIDGEVTEVKGES